MAKFNKGNKIGSWSFLIGVILALLFGLFGTFNQGAIMILVFLGLIIGLLNIADEEVSPFLMSGAVLVVVSALGQGVVDGIPVFSNVLQAITVLFVPATIIVALKNVLSLARR
ncbi:MAG: hypothetical protein AABY10_00815 [Nanoarchaeota archaeon]